MHNEIAWDVNKIFQILPLYDTYIERPKAKKLNNVQLLKKLPFYDKLSIDKNKTAFSGYAQSYKIEIVNKRDVVVQLNLVKSLLKSCLKTC